MKVNEIIEQIKGHVECKQYGAELVLKECPFCNRDKSRFYINTKTGQYSCKSASCGAKGNLNTLLPKIGLDSVHIEYDDVATAPKRAHIPHREITVTNIGFIPEDHELTDYMLSRGISHETLMKSGVLLSTKQNALTFITKHQGVIVGCLYRKPGKRIFMEAGSEQRLWGIGTFEENEKTLYITEGHPDCLTLREMGYYNSVSVPNGANSHEWINRDWDWLQQFEKIVLCYDNDEGGRNAIADVKSRLDFAQLFELEYGECNDVNEMFMVDCEALYKTVRHPKEISMDGFISLQNVTTESGVADELVSTGLAGFDGIFGGIGLHQSTIVMAEAGCGKSTVMSNMIRGLIGLGEKTAVWSGELSNKMLKTWLYSTIGGEEAINTCKHPFRENDVITSIKPEYERKIDKYVNGKLFVYDGNKSNGFNMLKHFEYLHKRFGVKYFFIDNLSILDMSIKGLGQYEAESEFAKQFASFTRNNAVHLFLVAHPTKVAINSDPNFVDRKGQVKNIERYTQQQVRGSATLVNLIHNVLVLARAKDHEKAYMKQKTGNAMVKAKQEAAIPSMEKMMDEEFSLMAYLVKNRSGGYIYEDALFGYDRRTRRIYGLRTKDKDLKSGDIFDKQDKAVETEDTIVYEYSDF